MALRVRMMGQEALGGEGREEGKGRGGWNGCELATNDPGKAGRREVQRAGFWSGIMSAVMFCISVTQMLVRTVRR